MSKETPDNSSVNIDLIRGHMDTIILRTLSDGDKYGYEILSEIAERSNNLYSLKQPTLYNCLKRLEKQGLLTSYKGDLSYGAQRVYYSLTDLGKQFLENDQIQWEFSRTIINNLLSDKDYDPEKQPKPFDVSSFRPLTRRQRNDANYFATVDPKDLEMQSYDNDADADDSADDDDVPQYGTAIYSEPQSDDCQTNETAHTGDNSNCDYPVAAEPSSEDKPVKSEEGYTGKVNISQTDDSVKYSTQDYSDYYDRYINLNSTQYNNNNYVPDSNADTDGRISDPDNGKVSDVRNTGEKQIDLFNYSYDVSDNLMQSEEDVLRRAKANDILYGEEPYPGNIRENEQSEFTGYKAEFGFYEPAQNNNYVESLSKLYTRGEPAADADEENQEIPVAVKEKRHMSSADDPLTLNQMRDVFYAQGYNLKPYSRTTNSEYYVNKYFYINRLLRDTTAIMYVLYVIELILSALFKGISWEACALAAGVGLIVPILVFIVCAVNPHKRVRAVYNSKGAMVNALVFCIAYIFLVFVLGFFVFGVRNDIPQSWIKPIVIPLAFVINVPVAVLIYSKLYSTKHYHIN